MQVGDKNRPPLSPREGRISDGRQVLHFRPSRWDRESAAGGHGGGASSYLGIGQLEGQLPGSSTAAER